MRKHDANTKKGKLINFQIGIIAVFCFVYTMHQVHTYKPLKAKKTSLELEDDLIFESIGAVIPVVPESKPIAVQPKIKPKPVSLEVVEPVKNDVPEIVDTTKTETAVENTPTETVANSDANVESTNKSTSKPKAPVISRPYTARSVDVLPIFPSCAKFSTNDELAACFQQKVQRMIHKKFNKNIGEEIGAEGIQHTSLYFEIDKNGEITNVKARNSNKHKEFEDEAKRVAKLLPKMEPAKSGNKNVKMAYTVPIVFRPGN